MAFRLRNMKYLLTWPQARDLNKQMIKEHIEKIEEIEYLVICEELHEDLNVHFHAFVIFKKKLNSRVNLFNIEENVCNVQVCKNTKGDISRCIAYVKEDGDWIEFGNRPELSKKMERKEKLEFVKQHSIKECIESGNFSISEIRNLEYVKMHLEEKRPERERIVYWFYGRTGSGKTREARRIALENYDENDIWFAIGNQREFKNGYKGQRCVIFDDFRNGCVAFNELLALCDRYPVDVNVKGSHCHWKADMIIFTCPDRPEDVFVKRNQFTGDVSEREDLQQLIRRINEIREFP